MSETQKHTKPNVPNLRFPGFEGEWEKCELGDIADITKGAGISKEQRSSEGTPCILYGELYTTYSTEIIDEVVSRTQLPADGLVKSRANDVIIPASGETAIDISTARCVTKSNVFLGGDLNIIRLKGQDGRFFSYQLNGVRKKDIAKIAQGVSIVHLHGGDLKHIEVNYPSQLEQKMISDLLSLIDHRIAIQNKVIEDYTTLEKEIQHQVFSRINAPHVPLSSISERVSERNSALESDNVLTISAREGLVSQLEFFNKSVASENLSNYYLLRKGDFAYNKSYSSDYPWGAIKHLERYDTGVLSPLYFCFRPNKEIVDTRYLQFFFDTKLWHKHIADIAVEGARNHGLLNMTVGDFYTMPILLPTLKEQKAIAEKLSAIRRKKVAEEAIYRLFLQQKRYLLEKLFV